MDMKAIVKGMTAGAAVGLAYYAMTSASPNKKRSIKRDAAKTMKMRKKRILGSQWVLSQLKISAVTASPPRSQVRPMMMQMGMV